MSDPHTDLILIWQAPEGPPVASDVLRQAMEDVESRLETVKLAQWSGDSEVLRTWIATDSPLDRVVVIPLSLFQISRSDLRAGLWFSGIPCSTMIFLGEPPTARELGTWIRNAACRSEEPNCVELIPPHAADSEIIDHLAAVAYWTGERCDCWIRGDRQFSKARTGIGGRCYLAFTPEAYSLDGGLYTHGAMMQCGDTVHPWDWLSADTLATWIMGRYLQALNAQPIAFADDSDDDRLLQYLKELADKQYSMLPKDYGGRLDAVTPFSMGSAQLAYDAQGKVPWDAIWTSFCDLAMAGGPPHRGTLLTNVPMDEIERQREQYDLVVAELRRGIELASKLTTCESKTAGWVGVCCHDERMAAWMLRAIIVENILVRREGTTLFLPAGPSFRIDKEIKNVITAVAKTTHYWFGHLKIRQPPKPL